MIPQIIYIVLLALSLGVSLAKHGYPRPNYSFGIAFVAAAVSVSLLAWGGFFAPLFT